MRYLLYLMPVFLSISLTYCIDENCLEEPSNSCAQISEYNAYVTCLGENRRQKRHTGCPLLQESCEYTDCDKCQESCEPTCEDCECPNQCRNCCSQTCTTNLCCHKTCHNQCKTNYCRSECKRECKQRVYEGDSSSSSSGSYSSANKQDVQIVEESTDTKQSKHNITTIINLHNIINNTNNIDIPIKINNTNYNNITLKRNDRNDITNSMGFDNQMWQSGNQQQETNENGEKCCYVVQPRQCVKTETYPFTKCFHYRHRTCAPYCVARIVHAQPQNFCDDQGCRNKIFYVPQMQPRCSYQPNWPFVNCGQQTFHNCHGCYDHQVNSHHHLRCSRCYDNGMGNGPLYRQGPYYQAPQSFYGAAPMYGGFPGAIQGFPGAFQGYPGAFQGYPGAFQGYPGAGIYPPMMQGYPAYPPMMPYPNIQGMPNNFMANDEIIDENHNLDNELTGIDVKSADNSNEVNMMLQYPATNYVHETIITPDQFNPNISLMNDQSKQVKEHNAATPTKVQSSRYALISISPENGKSHHEKKQKRYRRKKDKIVHTTEHDSTTELMLKDEGHTMETNITLTTASTF